MDEGDMRDEGDRVYFLLNALVHGVLVEDGEELVQRKLATLQPSEWPGGPAAREQCGQRIRCQAMLHLKLSHRHLHISVCSEELWFVRVHKNVIL